jgi:hypothetical protein
MTRATGIIDLFSDQSAQSVKDDLTENRLVLGIPL